MGQPKESEVLLGVLVSGQIGIDSRTVVDGERSEKSRNKEQKVGISKSGCRSLNLNYPPEVAWEGKVDQGQ